MQNVSLPNGISVEEFLNQLSDKSNTQFKDLGLGLGSSLDHQYKSQVKQQSQSAQIPSSMA